MDNKWWVLGFRTCLQAPRWQTRSLHVPRAGHKPLNHSTEHCVWHINKIISICSVPECGWNYEHETVNHTVNFIDPMTGANTQRIECHCGHMKTKLVRIMHGTSQHLFPATWQSTGISKMATWQSTGIRRCILKVHSLTS